MAKSEELTKEVVPSCLEDKKLIIKFFPKPKGFITNSKHVLYGGMLEGAVKILSTPVQRNGDFKNILTNDEKAYLEEYMGLGKDGLSVYKKEGNYWENLRVKLEKGENFFDLSSPDDFIKAKIAMSYTDIVAPSIDQIHDKITYMFYVIKEGDQDRDTQRKFTVKQEAYKLYGKYEEDRQVLEYVCKIIKGSSVAKNTKIGTLQAWIGEIIESNTKEFVSIISDKQLKTKMLIDAGVRVGAIRFIDSQYLTAEGKPIAEEGEPATLQNAANYLDKPVNQPVRLQIENRVKIKE